MSSPEREFHKDTNLNAILIDKNDLLKLDELIKTAFSSEGIISIKISTSYDTTNIKANSFDDFIAVNGMPDTLRRLDIDIIGNKKSIHIMLAGFRMHLSVTGNDETWVLGTFHKLSSYFSDKKPWFRSHNKARLIYIILLLLMAVITYNLYSKKYLYAGIVFTIIVLFAYCISFTSHFDKYFPSFELRLSPEKHIINKEMIVIILTALTLIVAIIGGIIIPLWSK